VEGARDQRLPHVLDRGNIRQQAMRGPIRIIGEVLRRHPSMEHI
jgi:hypothetical protein